VQRCVRLRALRNDGLSTLAERGPIGILRRLSVHRKIGLVLQELRVDSLKVSHERPRAGAPRTRLLY